MAKKGLEKMLLIASSVCAFVFSSDYNVVEPKFFPWGEEKAVRALWLNSRRCTWAEIEEGECNAKKADKALGEESLALHTQMFISIFKDFGGHEIEVLDSLAVNTASEPYASLADRTSGERALVSLCYSAMLEEAWIYSRGVWFEIGKSESYGGVVPDYGALRFASGEVSLYHFHPVDDRDKIDDSQFPSPYDFIQFAKTLKMMQSAYPSLKPDFRVAVSSGVYTVKFSPGALDDAEALDKAAEEAGKQLTHFISLVDYGQGNRKNFAKNNSALAKALSNELINVEFRAIDKY